MTADSAPVAEPGALPAATPLDRTRARRAALAGGVGTVIEYYDYSLYGFLAATIAPLFFPNSDPTAAMMSALLLFATGFLLRPFGGLIFGQIGDRYGRKRALLATLLTMGLASTAVGLVPTYESLGVWATALLVVFRGIQGVSAGGELGGSMTFIAESTHPGKRGAYGAASTIGIMVGFASAGAVVGLFSWLLPTAQFASWGWRVPFLLTLPLCLFCLWLRNRSEETLTQSEHPRIWTALRGLLAEDTRALTLATFASIAVNGTSYIGLGYLSVHLIKVLELPPTAVYWIAVVAILSSGGAAYVAGRCADRFGLMRVTLIGMVAFAALAIPAFALMTSGHLAAVLVAYTALMCAATVAAAPVLAAVPLLFLPQHRYTGTALAWNQGAVTAGASTPVIAFWLVDRLSSPIAPAAVCLLAAALGIVITFPIRRHLERRNHA